MQTTENLGLELIERDDPVGFGVINENMEKIDGAVATLGGGGHLCRIAAGTYTGDGKCGSPFPNTLTFGFKPLVVFVVWELGSITVTQVRGCVFHKSVGDDTIVTTWLDDGVSWYHPSNASIQLNGADRLYFYAAIGC